MFTLQVFREYVISIKKGLRKELAHIVSTTDLYTLVITIIIIILYHKCYYINIVQNIDKWSFQIVC